MGLDARRNEAAGPILQAAGERFSFARNSTFRLHHDRICHWALFRWLYLG